jgi:hypothetical protein
MASLIVAGVATPALAAPTLYARPGNRLAEVVNNTTSVVVSDTGDNNQLWALPPSSGTVNMSGVSFGSNVGFCQQMASLTKASAALSDAFADVFLDLESYQAELDDLRRQKATLDLQAQAMFESPFVQEIDDVTTEIDDITFRIDDLRLAVENCTTAECEEDIFDELAALQVRKRELQNEITQLRRDHREDYRNYTRLKNQVDAVDRSIASVFELATQRSGFISEGISQIDNLYAKYGVLEGGFANITYNSGWQANTLKLRQDNPGFSVSQIETRDAQVNIGLIAGLGGDAFAGSQPSLLGYTVNGREFDPRMPNQTLPAVPNEFQANARLSLIGACPTARPDLFPEVARSNGVPLFGLSATYTYPTAFKTHVKATYNVWKIYERMKKVTKKGGFFSSKTKVSETENTDGDSAFTFDFFDESGLSEWQRNEIKAQVELELMQDVLRLMGVAVPVTGGNVDPMPPPQPGALVLADGLSAGTCGVYTFYCTGASFILRGLSAVFGGSAAEASFRSAYDFTTSREYSTDAVYQRSALITFATPP